MSLLLPSPFCSYQLSELEFNQGSILTTLQKQCIQNQISEAAIKKLNLKVDPLNPLSNLQQEAELQGTILSLQYLLTLSESAELKLSANN